MSKITESARQEKCTIRLPNHCNHDPETTVFAHLNQVRFGKGFSLKCPDGIGAYACFNCHNVVDGREKTNIPLWYIQIYFLEAVIETILRLVAKGLIVIR